MLILSFAAAATACTDPSAPGTEPITISVNDGAPETRSRDVLVTVTAPGAVEVRVHDAAAAPPPFVPVAASYSLRLVPGDGQRTVLAQTRYADGRVSAMAQAEIVLAEQVYASPAGDDAAPGSFLRPKRSVRTAIATAAEEGRTHVRLFPGRYAASTTGEEFPIRPVAGLTLEALGLPVTLDAEGRNGVIRSEALTGVVLRGLRLTGGRAPRGGGLYIDGGSVMAEELVIGDNRATINGSGVYIAGGEVVFRRSVVASNWSDGDADAHGFHVEAGTAQVHNNVFALHDSNGLLVTGSAAADIRNNVFYRNGRTSPTFRGRGICEVSTPHRTAIAYNVFFGNVAAAVLFGGSGDLSAEQANAVSTTDGIEGNFTADPLFVEPEKGDFYLRPGSPAVNAGDPSPIFADRDGTRNDIGHTGGR